MVAETIHVVVAFALPERQWLWSLELPAGSAALDAVRQSPLFGRFPDLATQPLSLGVFGSACEPTHTLRAGDRVEVYRPLLIDPKEARRRRASGH